MNYRPNRLPTVARRFIAALVLTWALSFSAWGACPPAIYAPGAGPEEFVVLGPESTAKTPGQRYLFLDGRRGSTGDPQTPVVCEGDAAVYEAHRWPRVKTLETDATFNSAATALAGRLIEPPGPP